MRTISTVAEPGLAANRRMSSAEPTSVASTLVAGSLETAAHPSNAFAKFRAGEPPTQGAAPGVPGLCKASVEEFLLTLLNPQGAITRLRSHYGEGEPPVHRSRLGLSETPIVEGSWNEIDLDIVHERARVPVRPHDAFPAIGVE